MTYERLPRVYLFGTGGTISFVGESRTDFANYSYQGRQLTIREMLARVPEAETLAEVLAEQVINVGSTEVYPKHWITLANRINEQFASDDSAAGIAVTHGTATLEETAYFLNLTVRDRRPVAVTGAMRPPSAMGTDADNNLLDAIRVAASPDSAGRGALVVLNNEIQSARDVTKTDSYRVETFQSGHMGFLGYSDSDGAVTYYRRPERRHTADSEFEVSNIWELPQVDIAYAYAGVNGTVVDALVESGVKGIVAAGLGSGGSPSPFMAALRRAVAAGVPVVIATHVGTGRVLQTRRFTEDGYIVADNLHPKKARILLMLGLTVTSDPGELQRMMLEY
ncbi:MAG: asparaginase [Chloroflexota bacterium]|nr:asparaginase [Chloroflexota bacterium]